MEKTNGKKWSITKLQLFMFVFVLQAGTTFINFQYRMISASEQHAWIIFLLVCLLHLLIYMMYIKWGHHFIPNRFETKLFQLYWSFLIVVFLSKVVFVAQLWVFPETPALVVLLCISAVFIYALTAPPSVAFNLSVLLAPLFLLLIGSLFLSWPELVWLNLLPLSGLTWGEVANGSFQALSAFSGMEALLFLQPKLAKDKKLKMKDILLFLGVYSFFLTLTIVFTLLYFSLEEIKIIPFALMYLLKSQEITFIERIDLIFVYLWISWSIISIILYGSLILQASSSIIPKAKKLVIPVLVIIFITNFFLTRYEVTRLHNSMLYLSFIFSFLIPVFIIMKGRWRKHE